MLHFTTLLLSIWCQWCWPLYWCLFFRSGIMCACGFATCLHWKERWSSVVLGVVNEAVVKCQCRYWTRFGWRYENGHFEMLLLDWRAQRVSLESAKQCSVVWGVVEWKSVGMWLWEENPQWVRVHWKCWFFGALSVMLTSNSEMSQSPLSENLNSLGVLLFICNVHTCLCLLCRWWEWVFWGPFWTMFSSVAAAYKCISYKTCLLHMVVEWSSG